MEGPISRAMKGIIASASKRPSACETDLIKRLNSSSASAIRWKVKRKPFVVDTSAGTPTTRTVERARRLRRKSREGKGKLTERLGKNREKGANDGKTQSKDLQSTGI